MLNDYIEVISENNQEGINTVGKFKNIILEDIKAIFKLYKPIEEHLPELEKEDIEQLNRCALILEGK
jgi:hypothetical protein